MLELSKIALSFFLLKYIVFFCHHDAIPFINLCPLVSDSVVVSQLWKITVPTARSRRVLYQLVGSEQLSLPRGSNSVGEVSQLQQMRACPNTGLQSCLIETDWIMHNQPPRQNQSVVSKSCRATSCYFPPVLYTSGLPRVWTDDWNDVSFWVWSLLQTPKRISRWCLFSFTVAFLIFRHGAIAKWFCSIHLAVQEAEPNFGAVNHPSEILHIDAALLPPTGRVIGERRVPFNVLYCLQIFWRHFLQPVTVLMKYKHPGTVLIVKAVCM